MSIQRKTTVFICISFLFNDLCLAYKTDYMNVSLTCSLRAFSRATLTESWRLTLLIPTRRLAGLLSGLM